MKIYHQPIELIIKGSSSTKPLGKSVLNVKSLLNKAGLQVESVRNSNAGAPPAKGKALKPQKDARLYVKTRLRDSEMNPWDAAHAAAEALGAGASFIEPDLLHEYTMPNNLHVSHKKAIAKGSDDGDGYDPDWQPHQDTVWHLGEQFSQLKAAREEVEGVDFTIRIGHLDTGYSKEHTIVPDKVRRNKLQRNFVEGEDAGDAHDRMLSGGLRNPGHGTGTLGLLAGNKVKIGTPVFNDYLGGAYFADVISCRVSTSVVLIKTSAFAEAIDYLTGLTLAGTPVHVVSMSMGGAPSQAWADAVNKAYEAGITLVTAAGNNFNGLPTQHIIYPARFQRVIGACGVTYDFKPYHTTKLGEMRGCFGPERHMKKALAAFTPNTPWASTQKNTVRFSGAGTSSATPQIASAAAIYYRKHYKSLEKLQPWQRVEAIRYALYKSASQKGRPTDGNSFAHCFGNGILQAKNALAIPVNTSVTKTPEDGIPLFPVLTTIFKGLPGKKGGSKLQMYNTELAQLVFHYPELRAIIRYDEQAPHEVSADDWKKFAHAVIAHPAASIALKKHLMLSYKKST
jgi:subtilisin family serine protease